MREIPLRVTGDDGSVCLNVAGEGAARLSMEQVRIIRENRKCVYVDTTENWNLQVSFVPERGDIIVYSDWESVSDEAGNVTWLPGVKIGDGNAYCVDLPFITDAIARDLLDHMSDRQAHVTQAEREFWNNKLNYNMTGEELKLTRN